VYRCSGPWFIIFTIVVESWDQRRCGAPFGWSCCWVVNWIIALQPYYRTEPYVSIEGMDNPVSQNQLVSDIRKDIGGCPYLLLQVPILSENSIIRKSFKQLSKKIHPDKLKDPTSEEKEKKKNYFNGSITRNIS
jgi:hypothetical protein